MFFQFKSSLKVSAFVLCLILFLVSSFAQAALVEIPELKTRVTDLTQTLTQPQQAALEAKLAAFEQKKGSQIAVLIVPTTQPEDIAQYSIRVADAWKLGREKSEDGILLLIAKDDKKSRIEVGYGLEGAVNDLTAHRIRTEVMRPLIRAGDIFGGIDAGVDQLIKVIDGETLPAPSGEAFNGKAIENMLPLLLFGGLISGLFLRSMFGTFPGSALNGGLVGGAVWLLGAALGGAAVFAFAAFIFTMMMGGGRGISGYGGIPTGGGWSGGANGGSGGGSSWGGGFGGGGASGDW